MIAPYRVPTDRDEDRLDAVRAPAGPGADGCAGMLGALLLATAIGVGCLAAAWEAGRRSAHPTTTHPATIDPTREAIAR